jgi:predicted MFS family arabinose efflux permease
VCAQYFGLDAAQNGYVLSGVGMLTILVNTTLIGFLTSRYTERRIVSVCILVAAASFFLSAFAAVSLTALLAYLVPITIAGAVSATILTGYAAQRGGASRSTVRSMRTETDRCSCEGVAPALWLALRMCLTIHVAPSAPSLIHVHSAVH